MSTGRKSQLEKFNARQAKAKAVDNMIAEQNAKAAMQTKTIEEKGAEILKTTTGREDVFAVIARDSMESFMKMWNNSMENVIRETVRTEVTAMIQTEMEAAMKGMFSGMQQAMESMVQSSLTQGKVEEVSDEPVEFDLTKVVPMDVLIKRTQLKQQASEGPLSQRVKAEEAIKKMNQEEYIMAVGEGSAIGTKEQLGLAGVDTDGDMMVMPTFRNPHITGKVDEMQGQDIDGEPKRYSKPRIMTCGLCGEAGHNKRTCPKK
jgi:hypothetical protein